MKNNKFILLISIILLFLPNKLTAQQNIKANFEYSNGQIFIHYTFAGKNDLQYKVSINLKKKNDASFSYIPENLSGSIGVGNFANKQDEIIWTLNENEKKSLQGNDFYFQIFADEIPKESSGGIAWYTYVGTILLGGGAAAVLLLNKKSPTTASTTPTTGGFASPPSRP